MFLFKVKADIFVKYLKENILKKKKKILHNNLQYILL